MSLRHALLGLFLATLAAAVLLLPTRELLGAAFAWMELHRGVSWAVFVGVCAVATICLVPGTPLMLAGGALFDVGAGAALGSIGATLGATIAFLVGRTLARDWIAARIGHWSRFRAIDRAVGSRGFIIVLLTRLTPAMPCFLLNYAFGITSVRLREYVLGSWLGMLPLTVAYAYAGSLAADLAEALAGGARIKGPGWMPVALGLTVSAVMVALVTGIARRQLSRATGEDFPEKAR